MQLSFRNSVEKLVHLKTRGTDPAGHAVMSELVRKIYLSPR